MFGIQSGIGRRFCIYLVPVVIVIGEGVINCPKAQLGECAPKFLRRHALMKDILDHSMDREAGAGNVWAAGADAGVVRNMGMQYFGHMILRKLGSIAYSGRHESVKWNVSACPPLSPAFSKGLRDGN